MTSIEDSDLLSSLINIKDNLDLLESAPEFFFIYKKVYGKIYRLLKEGC